MSTHPSGPHVVPVDRVVAEMTWWLEHPWPIPESKLGAALAELGWRRLGPESPLARTDHPIDDPDAGLVIQEGYVYRIYYKVSDLVSNPSEADRDGFGHLFGSVVRAMTQLRGPGIARDGAKPAVGWISNGGVLVEIVWGLKSVVVDVLSPAAEFDQRVAAAQQT